MVNYQYLKGNVKAIITYLEHLQKETSQGNLIGYYEGQNDNSQWFGNAAEKLGLSGNVDAEDFAKILTGEFEGIDRMKNATRHGVDITFSAPKSVSLVGLAGNDEQIAADHREAVKAALKYLESEMMTTRTGKNGVNREYTGNLVAAMYQHEDSRPIDGIADPQLHDHCIIANLTQTEEGTWRTIDIDFGKNNEKLYLLDTIYKRELESRLRERGYNTYATEDGFEIMGVEREQIEKFSRRYQAINEELERRGLSRDTATAEQREDAAMAVRETKNQISQSSQREEWEQRAYESGLDLENIVQRGQEQFNALSSEEKELLQPLSLDKAIEFAVEHHFERSEYVSEEQVIKTIIEKSSEVDMEAVKQGIANHPELLMQVEDRDGKPAYISTKTLEQEGEIIGFMQSTKKTFKPFMTPEKAKTYVDNLNEELKKKGIEAGRPIEQCGFKKGQKDTLEFLLTNTDKVLGIVGAAGVGKTFSAEYAVKIAQENGYEVIGLGPSAVASAGLADAGTDRNVTLKEFLLTDSKKKVEGPRMIILDEAGMASTNDMHQLIKTLRPNDKLVLQGDPKQILAVEAGTPFEMLQEYGMEYSVMDEIVRQKSAQQRSIGEDFAKGKGLEAVKKLDKYIEEIELPEEIKGKPGRPKKGEERVTKDKVDKIAVKNAVLTERAIQQFFDVRDDQETLILCSTNAVREMINDSMREKLIDNGELSHRSAELQQLRKTDFTRAEKKEARNYQPGMTVYHKNKPKVIAKVDLVRHTLITTDGEEIKPSTFNDAVRSYKPQDFEVRVGDTVMFKENDKNIEITEGPDAAEPGEKPNTLKNGYKAKVKEIRDGQIFFDNGVVLPEGSNIPIEYGYAQTAHSAQGRTVPRAIVVGEHSKVATANLGYVSVTRQKDDLFIITDNKDKLLERWSKEAEKKSVAIAIKNEKQKLLEEQLNSKQEKEPVVEVTEQGKVDKVVAHDAVLYSTVMEGRVDGDISTTRMEPENLLGEPNIHINDVRAIEAAREKRLKQTPVQRFMEYVKQYEKFLKYFKLDQNERTNVEEISVEQWCDSQSQTLDEIKRNEQEFNSISLTD